VSSVRAHGCGVGFRVFHGGKITNAVCAGHEHRAKQKLN